MLQSEFWTICNLLNSNQLVIRTGNCNCPICCSPKHLLKELMSCLISTKTFCCIVSDTRMYFVKMWCILGWYIMYFRQIFVQKGGSNLRRSSRRDLQRRSLSHDTLMSDWIIRMLGEASEASSSTTKGSLSRWQSN